MAIPTLFKHLPVDKAKTEARFKWDLTLSLLALAIIGAYAAVSVIDILTKTSYEGICSNENVTAKVLCDDWVFRQCSYFGDQVGVQADTTHDDYVANGGTMSKEDCKIEEGGGCPVFDVTSPNFCTNWKGGRMLGDGELYTYLWQTNNNQNNNQNNNNNNQNQNTDTVEFNGLAQSSNYMCCGQIEQTQIQKVIIWLGVLGGTAGLIIKIITAIPPCGCVKKVENAENHRV